MAAFPIKSERRLPKKFPAPLVIHSEFLHRAFANPCTMENKAAAGAVFAFGN
jgi:hypothetical protein